MTFAESWLLKIFKDPRIKNPCDVKTIIYAAKAVGLTRRDLKTARKNLGIHSLAINGVQHWMYAQEENDARK